MTSSQRSPEIVFERRAISDTSVAKADAIHYRRERVKICKSCSYTEDALPRSAILVCFSAPILAGRHDPADLRNLRPTVCVSGGDNRAARKSIRHRFQYWRGTDVKALFCFWRHFAGFGRIADH